MKFALNKLTDLLIKSKLIVVWQDFLSLLSFLLDKTVYIFAHLHFHTTVLN